MTLKKDINKVICYLTGHKPIKILYAGFPMGISVITKCKRCDKTLAWLKLKDMTSKEASEIYNIMLEDKIEFNNLSPINSFEAIDHIRYKLKQVMDQNL